MKETNPKLIGVFVVGAIMLLVAALVLFSSQDLFTPKRKFVAYFQQSVNGLNVGASVRFRGIPIGQVLRIEGIYDPEQGNMIPRLILEVRPETMANAVLKEGEYTLFPLLVKNGMRASLKSGSLLTGQLYVSLDFHPDEPVRQLGNGEDEYPEMPTIESGFDEAIAKLSDLPLQEVLARMSATLLATEDLLRNPDVAKTIAALPALLTNTGNTVGDLRHYINNDLSPATNSLNKTVTDTGSSLQGLITTLNDSSLSRVETTVGEIDKTLQLAQQRLSKDDAITLELLTTLREVSGAARSARELVDYLKQHPESLIRGKSQ